MKIGIVTVGLVWGMSAALAGTVANAQQPSAPQKKPTLAAPSPTSNSLESPKGSNLANALSAGEMGGSAAIATMSGDAGLADTRSSQISVEKARSK